MGIGKSIINIHCKIPAEEDSEFLRWRHKAQKGHQPFFGPRDGKKCASWKPWWLGHESICRLDNGISANSLAPLEGYLKLEERPKKEPSIYQAHSPSPITSILHHSPQVLKNSPDRSVWKYLKTKWNNFGQNDRIHKEDWTHFAFNSEQSLKCWIWKSEKLVDPENLRLI